MSQLLFIKWDEDNIINYPIVDEQHRGLVATINSLYYFIQQGWEIKDLKPTILMLEQYVMFHLKTEQSILSSQGLSEDEIKPIQEYSSSFLHDLHNVVTDAIAHEEPQELSKYLAKWWQGHKVEFHDKLSKYFVK